MTDIKDSDPGFRKTLKTLKGPDEIRAGLLGDVESFLLMIGTANEFGTEWPSGAEHIPSRPFIRSTYDIYRDEIAKMIDAQIINIILGKTSKEKVLKSIGVFFVGKVKARIGEKPSPFKENAASTLAAKFPKDQPLIVTGRMRSAIAYELVK